MGKAKRAQKTKVEASDDEMENVEQNTDLDAKGKKEKDQEKPHAKNKKKAKKTQQDAESEEVKSNKPVSEEEEKAYSAPQTKKKLEKKEEEKGGAKPKVEMHHEEDNLSDGDGDSKKKKKDKKKKGKEEKKDDKKKKDDDKKKKKGPGKAALLAMQETLKKLQEEEDAAKREEEEKLRKIEEEERRKEEKIRWEKEKKEREKQKKKERLQRAKAEGRYLTPKQKAERARAEAMLEALKAQGLELPDKSTERSSKGARVIQPKGKKPGTKAPDAGDVKTEDIPAEEQKIEVQILDEKQENEEEEEEESDDVKDTWEDAEDDVEEESEEKEEAEDSKSEAEETDEGLQEEESESESEEEEEHKTEAQKRREKALERIRKRKEEAEKRRNTEVLRAPVVCVLGHVDTGKTKILDKLRRTHVQEGEAGGITQQIGATNVPGEAIKAQSRMVKGFRDYDLKIPGMLIIDTPGHESFSNLRSRGSSLCDIAILVIDIMHGLEPQTLESINLLKKGKTPFLVALNKIDRLYDWVTDKNKDVEDVLKQQPKNTQQEFKERVNKAVVELAEQGLNAKLSYENNNPREYISLVPTSAVTGEGMGNLIALLSQLTQTLLQKRLASTPELQAVILEVKTIPGHGTTTDVILVNGTLHVGDTIVLAGTDGPIVTQIRALLMPQPMKELRVKNTYFEPKEVTGAQGVKIVAKELEKVVAGLNLHVAEHPDEIEIMKEEVVKEFKSVMSSIKLSERGVFVQASTLGSLEALLEFLRTSNIPYSGVRIGPVTKKSIMKASIMLEHEILYAVILAFDVRIERDAQDLADNLGVKIFQADIIYHLFDSFMKYQTDLKDKRKEEHKHIAVFPCKMKILPQFIFNSRDPIVVGVSIEAGVIRDGTPICVQGKEGGFIPIGVVTTIEINHKAIPEARKGQEVCIKIEPLPGEAPKMIGRHFDEKDLLLSKITRESIDACKNYFRDDLLKSDWQLMIELKKLFAIL